MKWALIIVWLAGNGTPATVIPVESESLCVEARDRVMRPQPLTNPIVAERKPIATALCVQVAR